MGVCITVMESMRKGRFAFLYIHDITLAAAVSGIVLRVRCTVAEKTKKTKRSILNSFANTHMQYREGEEGSGSDAGDGGSDGGDAGDAGGGDGGGGCGGGCGGGD